jgi:hypothetical protein
MNRPLGLFLLSLSLAVVGCSQGEKSIYANVSGTVTFNDQPVEKGQITFALEGRPPSTMDIVDGKFNGQAMVGSNKVSVSAKRKSGTAPKVNAEADKQIKGYKEFMKGKGEFGGPPADYDPTMVEYIPQDWGPASKQMRVVESGATNEFKFEIKGEKK